MRQGIGLECQPSLFKFNANTPEVGLAAAKYGPSLYVIQAPSNSIVKTSALINAEHTLRFAGCYKVLNGSNVKASISANNKYGRCIKVCRHIISEYVPSMALDSCNVRRSNFTKEFRDPF